MKISIAMATYNGAQYLKAQLQSFIDQTRQPDELIITDDCSTDETETIVQEFAEVVPFKVEFYLNEKSLGYCGNFNAALMKTTGDLVFLSDQDDVWFPEKIEYMLGVAERNPEALLVMNDAALTDGELNEVGLTKMGQIRSAGMPMQSFVMGCCCGIRRELLDLCMPIPVGFRAHDDWLVGIAEGLGTKVVDNATLQFYRRHEANESQFIANRTTKVTRLQRVSQSVMGLFAKNSREKEKERLEQMKIYASGIKLIMRKAPDKYQVSLTQILETTETKVRSLMNRIQVREKRFIPRVIAAVQLLIRGGYDDTSGFKAVMRDLLG